MSDCVVGKSELEARKMDIPILFWFVVTVAQDAAYAISNLCNIDELPSLHHVLAKLDQVTMQGGDESEKTLNW